MKYFIPLFAVLFLISCSKEKDPVATSPLLKSYTVFTQNQGQFQPSEKVEYFYTPSGRLIKSDQSKYDSQGGTFVLFSTSNYSYNQDHLITIDNTITSSLQKSITNYEYTDGKVSRIIVDEYLDTDAQIEYLPGNEVKVVYTSSNGRWFTYRFTTTNNNKIFEQTIGDDQQLDSEVTHEYDDRKNPFSLLGYTDLFFANVSVNNRLKTASEFFAGATPPSVPISYQYEYNSLNYPTQQITTLKSLGQKGTLSLRKTVFEYWGAQK